MLTAKKLLASMFLLVAVCLCAAQADAGAIETPGKSEQGAIETPGLSVVEEVENPGLTTTLMVYSSMMMTIVQL